ncbi:Alpha/Beta hydrolase protein [Trametes gibbosa]|nr:Alpha/Beta hydrolase protein [Trametes gibbosa]
MNGGPGCSSLEGLLQEIGPFQWQWGQARPTRNEFSWTNLASVLFVEQPIGVGYSQGQSNLKDEDELSEQLVGFMQQFLDVFQELQGKKLYLTGESYAGMYIPYIADYLYEHPAALNLSLSGISLIDPVIGYEVVQCQIPAVDYVHKFEQVFALNQTFLAHINDTAERCGYAGYIDKYVTYPPKGPLPLPGDSIDVSRECNVWDEIMYAALAINPAFNVFRVFDTWPILWDVLGYPGTYPQAQSPIYFDREDVKRAIHAPVDVPWVGCTEEIFMDYVDQSVPSSYSVLPKVIERSERAVIVHGLADFILIADGTRILIQNMTWNGLQGFQRPIPVDSFVVDGMGALGSTHTERGLTYFEVSLAGHMVPQFSPKASFQIMEYLLGFRKTPSQKPGIDPRN